MFYLDTVNIESVFSVLSRQHHEHRSGARVAEVDEFHREMSRVALDTRSS